MGSEIRVKLIARDLIEHFEQRQTALAGKAMVVVMSRRIAVELYRELVALRPAWHGDTDDEGALKVVMTGSPPTRSSGRTTSATKRPARRLRSASATPKTRSASS